MADATRWVWVTKYALTKGILHIGASPCRGEPAMVETRALGYSQYFHKDEWWATPEEAEAEAERMQQRRIASLQKQIAKLQSQRIQAPR